MKQRKRWIECVAVFVLLFTVMLGHAFRDPTQPVGYVGRVTSSSGFQLQSIIYGKNRKEAVINQQIFREGDTVNGAKIVAIHRDFVVLSQNAKIVELHLFAGDMRKSTKMEGKKR